MKRIARIAFVILFALSAVAAAKEDKPLPKDLPPYGQDKPLPVPEIAQRTLGNGLTVWVVPRQGLPKVNVVLAVRGGLAADGAGRDGMSSLCAGLLTDGTKARTSRQIAEELQAIGGSIGAGASLDGVTLFGDAFQSRVAPLLEILADVARNASFPDSEVDARQGQRAAGPEGQRGAAGLPGRARARRDRLRRASVRRGPARPKPRSTPRPRTPCVRCIASASVRIARCW